MSIRLVEPHIKYKESLLKYIAAFHQMEEEIHGSSCIANYKTIEEWLIFCEKIKHHETCPDNFVTAYQFLLINDQTQDVIGMINCRLKLNDYLLKKGGHIGYSIHPSFRKKGLAKLQLKYALEIYKEIGIQRVLITCDKDNIASSKTIQSLNGKLENEIIDNNMIVQRFWIELT